MKFALFILIKVYGKIKNKIMGKEKGESKKGHTALDARHREYKEKG